MDGAWWEVHHAEVARTFRGERFSSCATSSRYGMKRLGGDGHRFNPQGNSGAAAILLALLMGARRVVLLGYDCQHTGGRAHWHGDHPPGTAGNAGIRTLRKWPGQFRAVAKQAGAVPIINCTRETALDVFPRGELEQALC